jgi:hypothetical protein
VSTSPRRLETAIRATERQLESLQKEVAETYPGDNKIAWPVTVMLKELNRLKLLIAVSESEG